MDRDHRPTEAYARERDSEADPADLRDRFSVPDECYMDGNSLGSLSDAAERTLQRAIDQWRDLGIRAWTDAEPPWFRYGELLGDRIAPLVGATPGEVVAANATTVNIHTLVGTFLNDLGPGEDRTVLVNELDFPTDHYAIRGQLRNRGLDPDEHLLKVPSRDGRTIHVEDVVAAIEDEDVGIVFMPSVLYRSGQLFDLERITEAAHDNGAVAGFDLAHSVGVVDHDLSAVGADFAVWCSYKYLNAGPGAVAGLYVPQRHHGRLPGLPGWWGHEKATQFEMRPTYTPADSAGAWQIGTVPVLAAAPLFGALDVVREAGIEAVRERSLSLTSFLIHLAEDRLSEYGVTVGTPRDPARRGGHVALEHEEGYRISEALRDRGVVVDFRPPDVVRVCPAPLYTGFLDVFRVVEHLEEILAREQYERYDPRGGGVT